MHFYANSAHVALLDTNLLTVLLVGQLGVGSIEKNKKTRQYTSDDFILLNDLLSQFKDIITTPHILAETVNLIDWVQGEHRQILFAYLADFISQKQEIYLSAKDIIKSPAFIHLGLTDGAIFELAKDTHTVLITADLPLYAFGVNHGIKTINFNHIRDRHFQ
ncbi:Uncharacterised protein [Moraxella lacunata]|uniref:PIN domain-containing protein n=1 Tax=Moraxella lacunata TaxID=477 RepID=A0A378TUG7_MORLA|nr:PIN domain-containing protein [Moraxella lacunata]STZ63610.1 Uncharacterised protein [Moraxella lacunata]